MMGVGLATLGEIRFKNGRVEQDNFDTYEVTRMNEAPREIRVHIVPGGDYAKPMGGVGEPGVPPIPPALCNAIFAATGKRIRRCRSAISSPSEAGRPGASPSAAPRARPAPAC